MALIEASTRVQEEDEPKEQLEHFKTLVSIKRMTGILQSRLYLSKCIPNFSSYPRPGDLSKQELGLMDAIHRYQKTMSNRQLVNIAIHKSIQSTLVSLMSKNLQQYKNLSFIEDMDMIVAQMKRMLYLSESAKNLKKDIDEQHLTLMDLRQNRVKFDDVYRKLHEKSETSEENGHLEKEEDLRKMIAKKITNMKIMSAIISAVVSKFINQCDDDMILRSTNWRKCRAFNYYYSKCKSE